MDPIAGYVSSVGIRTGFVRATATCRTARQERVVAAPKRRSTSTSSASASATKAGVRGRKEAVSRIEERVVEVVKEKEEGRRREGGRRRRRTRAASGDEPVAASIAAREGDLKGPNEDEDGKQEEVQSDCTGMESDEVERLVKAYIPLVYTQAKKFRWGSAAHYDDIVQEGCIGLLHAARKYKRSKNLAFATYATYWIRQAMARGLWKSRLMHLPHRQYQLAIQVKRALSQMADERIDGPTKEELARRLGWDDAKLKAGLEAHALLSTCVSLDRAIADDGSTIMDVFPTEGKSTSLEECSQLEAVENFYRILDGTLKPRETEVLSSSYGLRSKQRLSRKELAKGLKVSETTITNTKLRAIEKLRAKQEELAPYLTMM